ncbi:MAG TPA: hypothetical protein VG099_23415 [Gemmataceae bacterium]|jgi:hypothetical protein|nr:hypothetical protein [Gemmataceae bacterium]
MRCTIASALLVVFAGTGLIRANGPASAEIDAMRKQVKYLKAQESAVVKAVKARYHAAISQTHRTEEVLAAERRALGKEESELLGFATTQADKDKIHAQYDQLRATLRTDVKIDSKMIAAMRTQESAAVKQVQNAYRAQVKVLEAQIKSLEQANKGGRKK